MRYMDWVLPWTYLGRACIMSGRKCFHERIFLAADGIARMVDSQSGGN